MQQLCFFRRRFTHLSVRFRRHSAMIIGIIALVMSISACQKTSSQHEADSLKTIVVARPDEPEWLNPVAGHQHADSDMAIFRGLFKINAQNILVPDMAESWTVSPDGLLYTIQLRPGIKWHDGESFTADDVKFTVETIQNPKNHSGLRKEVEEIKTIEVVNPLAVRIVLSRPLSSLPHKLKIGMIPRHILEGKDFNTDEFNYRHPIGTGPFKLTEWKRGEYLILQANPDFYTGRPKLDRVIYKFLPDPNVRLVQLKKGEVDVAMITPKQVASISPSDKLQVETVDTADYRVMMFNFRKTTFQDIRVRQAIQYATDRQGLVNGALLGYGTPAYGPLQFHGLKSSDMPRHDNDLKKAEVLLTEAGWTRGKDGVLAKNGKRFSFVLSVPASDPVRADLAALLAEQLKKVGVEALIQIKDWASFNITDAEALILGGGLPDDPDDDLHPFFSSHVGEEGSNYSGYHNKRVDLLLDQARGTLDPEARQKVYREIQKELIDDPPYNYLVYLKHTYAVREGFTGFAHRIFGHGTSPLWNIEDWDYIGEK